MSAATLSSTAIAVKEKRHVGMGIFFLLVALAIAALFAFNTTSDMTTTFGLNPGAKTNAPRLGEWVVPTQATLWVLTVVVAFVGGWQLARGFKNINVALLIVVLIFIFAFLTWAARGISMNLLGMISASLLRAAPIALGALSGILCERCGVVNIAIEGMMLSGAMVSVVVASIFRNYDAVNQVPNGFPSWLVTSAGA
jgi:simple sugar transport system permease protein